MVGRRADYAVAYILPFIFPLWTYFILQSTVKIDLNSTRHLLSSLAQCEAAIMAIVISLSLIAIQLASSSYSHMLIDLFLKTPEFWLLFVYIGSIVLTLLTLRFVNVYSKQYIAFLTAVCCSLGGVFCFFWLIPYTLTMIDLLRPGTILNNILNEVKKTKDQNKITHMINMYFAVIIRALSQHKYVSAAEGLIKIGDVLEYFDEDSLLQIYLWIRDTIKLMKESGSEIIICESIEDVCKNIGLIAISKNYRWVNEIISLI